MLEGETANKKLNFKGTSHKFYIFQVYSSVEFNFYLTLSFIKHMMDILYKIFFLNILDSQPTLQRLNLSRQLEAVSDRKLCVKLTPQKDISLRTHADSGFLPRGNTEIYFWASLGHLFCPYVRKLQTLISGVSRFQSSPVYSMRQPPIPQSRTTKRNSLNTNVVIIQTTKHNEIK